jgi:integrase
VDTAPPGAPRRPKWKGGFITKAAAIAAMNELQVDVANATHVEPSKQTVGEYLALWVAGGCGGVRPWTLRGYSSAVRVHLIPRIGAIRLQALRREQIKALYGELRRSGWAKGSTPDRVSQLRQIADRYRSLRAGSTPRSAVRTLVEETGRPEATVRHWIRRCRDLGLLQEGREVRSRGLSPKAVWNIHVCLRAALNDAVEDGLLKWNPAKGTLRPPSGRKRMKTWTREEVSAFLDHLRQHRNVALYQLALYTGMRRGELLGLRWEDVRWSTSTISVQTQAGQTEEDEETYGDDLDEGPTKSEAGRRAIRVDGDVLQVLQQHREAQEFERRSWGDAYRDHGLVFCHGDGSPHDPDTISKSEFRRLVGAAAISRIRFHDMRHTHATLLLEAGVDITVVSRRLGHASVKTTADLYAHVTERLQIGAAEKFGAYLTPPELAAGTMDSATELGQ